MSEYKIDWRYINDPDAPDIELSIDNLTSSLADMTNHTKGSVNINEFANLKNGSDWTPAIVAAINATPYGGELLFSEGTYNHTGISINKSINFRGCGKYATILKNTSLVAPAVNINSNVERGTFRDIGIFGNGTTAYGTDATSGKGFVFNNNSVAWHFDNVWMRGHGDWFFYADGNGNVNNINITNSELEWGTKGAIHFVQSTYDNQINAVVIQNCSISGFGTNALELWGQSITIDNCAIQACKQRGIVIDGTISPVGAGHATNIRITNNYYEQCNQGFIFLNAITTPFARYINGVVIENNYGTYGKIAGIAFDSTNTYLVEIQAPNWYAYSNNQVSGVIYRSNSFNTNSGMCKGVLNGNDVLSYDSTIHKSILSTYSSTLENEYANLGRAKILTDTLSKKVIKGISSCFSHTYTIDKSPSITTTDTLKYDIFSFINGKFVSVTFPVNTDSTDYKVSIHIYYRAKNTTGAFTDYILNNFDHQNGNVVITHTYDGKSINNIYNDSECYIGIAISFNVTGQTYLYVGNLEIQSFS